MTHTIICAASGPSLTAEQAATCQGFDVLAVANAVQLFPRARWLYASDRGWWDHYHDDVRAIYGGPCYTISGHAAHRYGLMLLRSTSRPEYCKRVGQISNGANSGHCAMNLAAHLGARRIVLIGYDFAHSGGRAHFFGDHPEGMRNASNPALWLANMAKLAPGLAQAGIEVVNCSGHSAIDCFPRADLAQTLRDAT